MRTLELVKALNDFELKEMEHELNDGKRQNLLQLFRYLKKFRKEEKAPPVSELLKKVFAQKHTKANELQLRNKLSRLNEILYQFLATAEFKTQMAGNRHLLNQWLVTAYRNRKVPLLRNDMDTFIKTATDNFMLDEAAPMMRLRALIGGQPFEKNLNQLNEWQELEKQRFLFHYTAAEATKALYFDNENNRLQSQKSVWEKYKASNYTFDFKELKHNWPFQLFENSRLSLLPQNQKKRVFFLKKAEKALSETNTKHMLTRGVRENILLNIALSLMNEGRHSEALEYHEKHFAQMKQNQISVYAGAHVNYMVNLMLLERLEQAKEVYTENRSLITESEWSLPAALMYATACLFTNEEKIATRLLSEVPPQLEHVKLTTRNLYLMAFIMRKEFELAQTEGQNLKRAIPGYEQNEFIRDLKQVTYALTDFATAHKQGKPVNKKLLAKARDKAIQAKPLLKDDPVHRPILDWIIAGCG